MCPLGVQNYEMNHHLIKLQRLKLMLCAGKETESWFRATSETFFSEPRAIHHLWDEMWPPKSYQSCSSANMLSTSKQFLTCDSPGLQCQHQHLLGPRWLCQPAVCIVALWINSRTEASSPYINKPSERSLHLLKLILNPQPGSLELASFRWSLELQSQYFYRQPRSTRNGSAQGINSREGEAFSPSPSG